MRQNAYNIKTEFCVNEIKKKKTKKTYEKRAYKKTNCVCIFIKPGDQKEEKRWLMQRMQILTKSKAINIIIIFKAYIQIERKSTLYRQNSP